MSSARCSPISAGRNRRRSRPWYSSPSPPSATRRGTLSALGDQSTRPSPERTDRPDGQRPHRLAMNRLGARDQRVQRLRQSFVGFERPRLRKARLRRRRRGESEVVEQPPWNTPRRPSSRSSWRPIWRSAASVTAVIPHTPVWPHLGEKSRARDHGVCGRHGEPAARSVRSLRPWGHTLDELLKQSGSGLVLVCVDVHDPGNRSGAPHHGPRPASSGVILLQRVVRSVQSQGRAGERRGGRVPLVTAIRHAGASLALASHAFPLLSGWVPEGAPTTRRWPPTGPTAFVLGNEGAGLPGGEVVARLHGGLHDPDGGGNRVVERGQDGRRALLRGCAPPPDQSLEHLP